MSEDIRFRKAIELADKGDLREALSEGIALINSGFAHANTLVAHIYERGGESLTPDYEKAFFYYQQAVRTVGAVHGWLGIARLYYKGMGVEQSYEEAFKCYSTISEDTDHPVAWLNLGRMYKLGQGVAPDITKAKECFIKSANMGNAAAYYELSNVYKETGHWLKFMIWRLKTFLHSTVIAYKDPSDIRLTER